MPLEGGLYQWAKLGFNELTGFLVAWNLWIYVIVNSSELGLQVTTYLSYALGPRRALDGRHKPLIVGARLRADRQPGQRRRSAACAVGKWVHNAGGVLILVLFARARGPARRELLPRDAASCQPFSLALPAFTLLNLNILGKMGFGALGGFEYMAILAGECRDPARAIGRSVVIAVPIIAVDVHPRHGRRALFRPAGSDRPDRPDCAGADIGFSAARPRRARSCRS